MTDGVEDEAGVLLGDVITDVGDRLEYEYDFGDSWRHRLVVEEVSAEDAHQVRCLGGRRASPPEDCGGIWAYNELAEAWGASSHPAHGDAMNLLSNEPSWFDRELIEARLRRIPLVDSGRRLGRS
ncbi:MAG: plasmid pRiA4b ORF-3 family protein [Actinomycetales bacterium]|nr:plasmid pRiA4b ORF-3 family protein [Actinomycetales bacterium]